MDAEQLKKFKEEVFERLKTEKTMFEIQGQVNRLVSHYESELRANEENSKKLNEIDKEISGSASTAGLRNRVKTMEDYLADRRKQNNAIFLCVMGLVLKAGYEIVITTLKHTP